MRTVSVASLFSLLLALLLVCDSASAAAAKKDPKAEEAKEAAAEEAAEQAKIEELQHVFSGRVTFDETAQGDVCGTFTSAGTTYLLKAVSPHVRTQLKESHNKEVTLTGRPRNQGKYFVCQSVVPPELPPIIKKRRGGL